MFSDFFDIVVTVGRGPISSFERFLLWRRLYDLLCWLWKPVGWQTLENSSRWSKWGKRMADKLVLRMLLGRDTCQQEVSWPDCVSHWWRVWGLPMRMTADWSWSGSDMAMHAHGTVHSLTVCLTEQFTCIWQDAENYPEGSHSASWGNYHQLCVSIFFNLINVLLPFWLTVRIPWVSCVQPRS